MPFLHIPVLLFVLVAVPGQDAPAKPDCRAWQECRQLALDAATGRTSKPFTISPGGPCSSGRKNDPALMYLLARAQSLSGRPGDALVMLERLAALGVPLDAATNEDFRRVRGLPTVAGARSEDSPEPPRQLQVTAPGGKSAVEGSPAERSRAGKACRGRPPVESPAAEVVEGGPGSGCAVCRQARSPDTRCPRCPARARAASLHDAALHPGRAGL